jgi:Domain of unknown function (DUF6894)
MSRQCCLARAKLLLLRPGVDRSVRYRDRLRSRHEELRSPGKDSGVGGQQVRQGRCAGVVPGGLDVPHEELEPAGVAGRARPRVLMMRDIDAVQKEAAQSLADMARDAVSGRMLHRMAIEVRDDIGPLLDVRYRWQIRRLVR